jgi:membrane AbrB-like protein
VVLVTLIASTWYGTSGGPEEPSLAEELATTLEVARAGLLLVALGLTYVGVRLAAAARVPVAPLLGAMFVGAAYAQLLTFAPGVVVEFQPPELLDAVGQALLGITIGEYLGCRLALEARAVIYGMASVAATVLIGVVLASVLALWTSWSWLTCLLLTAPGGAPEMIVLALALDQEVELITAGHIIRQLAINGLLPFCLLLFRRIEARNR